MGKTDQLTVLLNSLQETMWFELVASNVIDRIVNATGHGLMIIQGPSKVSNKSRFLKLISSFQSGVPLNAAEYVSQDLRRKLDELNATRYQCINVKTDCEIEPDLELYRTPLSIVIPLSMAAASMKRGLKKGHKVVVLCDDLNEFLYRDAEPNIPFLRTLADSLDNHKDITFIGAYTVIVNGDFGNHGGSDLKETILAKYVLPLGYD